jgi:thiosulfate reductase cytochrome b subunit
MDARHATLVRITHWIHTVAFIGLLVSGIAILMAHPRLYWGETGAFGSPALIELPLPHDEYQSGWGRSLHFLSAWICVLNGAVYATWGFLTFHFRRNLLPKNTDLRSRRFLEVISSHLHLQHPGSEESYNVLQQLSYLIVVFFLFPLMIATGLAMSPAIGSVLPTLVLLFGGHQSARTIHFAATSLLVLFLIIHVAMVWLAGFRDRMRGMITSRM